MKITILTVTFIAATVFFGLAVEAKSPVFIAVAVACTILTVLLMLKHSHERTA
jgi:hypothetical protein